MYLRALCVGAVVFASSHNALAQLTIRTIWHTPSGSGIIQPPSINQLGRLGFIHSPTVRYVDLAGSNQVQIFATAGAPVSGGRPGDTWRPPTSHPLFDAQGRFVGRMSMTGNTGEDGIVFGTPGQFQVVARADLQPPGYAPGTTFARNAFGLPVMNPSGLVAFDARISGDNEGVWYRQPGGATSLLLGPNMPAPGFGAGVNVYAALNPRLNASGQFVLQGSLEGAGVTSENDEVVYWGDPANPQPLLREGQSIAGRTLAFFHRPTIDDSGSLAMWVGFRTTLTEQAIVAGAAGSLTPIARTGVRGPGMAAGETWGSNLDTTHFWYPVLTGSGNVVFWGQIEGSPRRGDSGLWTGDASGLTMVARSGSAVPGLPGVSILGPFRQEFAANALGDIVLQAGLTGEGVNSSNNQMFLYWNEASGLQPLVRLGDLFEVAPGVMRTISRLELVSNAGGEDGAPTALNNRREFTWRMAFTDGSTGIFVTVVPSPQGAMALLLGMGGVMTRRRRRQ